jgi:hypothetical protein
VRFWLVLVAEGEGVLAATNHGVPIGWDDINPDRA